MDSLEALPRASDSQLCSRSWNYNLGWDQRIGRKRFVRTTVFSPDRAIPHEEVIPSSECLSCNQSGHVRPALFEGELYEAGVGGDQFICHEVTLVTGYDFTQDEDLFLLRREHEGECRPLLRQFTGFLVKRRRELFPGEGMPGSRTSPDQSFHYGPKPHLRIP